MMGTKGQPWNENAIDQHVLDLLVDGEMSDEQERAVIARLDNTPDAWRRCALTFLESRCWQRAAETVTQPCQYKPQAARQAAAGWRAQPWTCALLMAASFLLAFGVGNFLPHGGNQPRRSQVVPPSPPGSRSGAELAHVKNSVAEPLQGPSTAASDLYLGNVRLVGEGGRELDVPVYDWNQQVADELLYGSQPLPAQVTRQLKRHNVRSSRSYLPVQLEDGRRVVFPVQEVDITPVRGTPY